MRSFIAFAVAASSAYADDKADKNVIVLTKDNADSVMKENSGGLLVEFYAPWCGHCKNLEPEYNKAADKLKEEGSKYRLAKVDATVEADLGSKYEVQGYPTLKWFVDGEASEYDGPREAEGIVTWIKSMTGPAVTDGEPPEDTKLAVVFTGAESPDWYKAVAGKNRKKAAWFFVKGSGDKVTLTHKGEPELTDDVKDEETMKAFLDKNQFPMFGALDGENFASYMSSGSGMIWTLLPMKADDDAKKAEKVAEVVEAARPEMVKVAKKMSGRFAVTWTNTEEFGAVLDNMFGIKEFPRIVIQKKIGSKPQFIYDDEITSEKILQYIQDIDDGKIEPVLKSEDVPEKNDEPVKVVVGKTMKEMLFQKEKDVLFEVYAPWCGHCKRLDPEFTKVAKKIIKEGVDDMVLLTKMDGTLNDSPDENISWSGFPTLYYVKAGSDKAEKYDGGRDAKGIWKWIKKNHSAGEAFTSKLSKGKKADKENEAPKKEKEEL